jgi:hypothetical protein
MVLTPEQEKILAEGQKRRNKMLRLRYLNSEKGKATSKKYQLSTKFKEYVKNYQSLPVVKNKMSLSSSRLVQNARNECFNLLGRKCVKCGFEDMRALQIDHIDGGGLEEKKKLGTYKMYKKILNHPELYQILCANCNWIKRHENNELRGRRKKKIEHKEELLKVCLKINKWF